MDFCVQIRWSCLYARLYASNVFAVSISEDRCIFTAMAFPSKRRCETLTSAGDLLLIPVPEETNAPTIPNHPLKKCIHRDRFS
jgi:hypothetical protein